MIMVMLTLVSFMTLLRKTSTKSGNLSKILYTLQNKESIRILLLVTQLVTL